jgi:hypothetical protein
MLEATKKMIESIKGFSYDQILQKVQEEYDAGIRVAERKRLILRQYLNDYNIDGDTMKP